MQPAKQPAAGGITFVDYDHDGDLDLFVTGQPSCRGSQAQRSVAATTSQQQHLYQLDGANGQLGGDGTTLAATLSDLNNDRAVDLLVTGSGQAPTFFANPREGPFKSSPLFAEAGLSPTVGAVVLDFNKDGWMDASPHPLRQPRHSRCGAMCRVSALNGFLYRFRM